MTPIGWSHPLCLGPYTHRADKLISLSLAVSVPPWDFSSNYVDLSGATRAPVAITDWIPQGASLVSLAKWTYFSRSMRSIP